MASNAIAGVGTKFYRWNSTSTAWEAIAEITSVNGPGMSRETIDVTSLDSTGGYREFIGSFRDAGTISLGMNYTRSTYDKMREDFESETAQNYKIILPDTAETTVEFEGLVQELPLSIEVGDKISVDVTIKVTGKPLVYDDSSGA